MHYIWRLLQVDLLPQAQACDIRTCMNKTILITGGATRIGRVLAKGLADDGWSVIVHYHNSKIQAEELATEISNEISNAVIVKADLTNNHDVNTLIDRAVQTIGVPLTALINNASTYTPDGAIDYDDDVFDNHLAVNLKAPLRLAQQFAKQLPDGKNGSIINMIDQRVLRPSGDFFTYSVSKSALYAATKTMAQTCAPNIRVNAIGPGPTLKSIHQTDVEFAHEVAHTLLGNGSPPDTILQAMRYLLSATAVTGQMIAVDGGQHLRV